MVEMGDKVEVKGFLYTQVPRYNLGCTINYTDRQADRQADRQTNRQTGRQTDRQTGRKLPNKEKETQ